MDNSQHYQPLSHALHPPVQQQVQAQVHPQQAPHFSIAAQQQQPSQAEEEEEEGDEGEEDEVEDAMDPEDHHDADYEPDDVGSADEPQQQQHTNNAPASSTAAPNTTQGTTHQSPSQPERRRPGRPRGSKTRRAIQAATPSRPSMSTTSTTAFSASVPPLRSGVTAQNQQYYEFQWRLLNLCAEFYGAAEELVKGTNPMVIAQCYQMGPGTKLDPMHMLHEAKQVCDNLLANPSQLIVTPPPPMYTVAPTYGHHYHTMPPSMPNVPASSHGSSAPIAHPQSFSVPMSSTAATTSHQATAASATIGAPTTATTTAAPTAAATTTPYTYSAPHMSAYYSTPMTSYHYSPYMFQAAAAAAATTTGNSVSAGPTANSPHAAGGSSSGSIAPLPAPPLSNRWTDDEVARLRQLAADKSTQVNGKTDWSLVANQFGPTRSYQQVLSKATLMGLRELTKTRKRRRRDGEEEEGTPGASDAVAATTAPQENGAAASAGSTSATPVSAAAAPPSGGASATPATA